MIDQNSIFEIHRLANEGLSIRKIARKLKRSRKTVVKYLNDPEPKRSPVHRPSKLDPFKEEVQRMLEVDHKASAVVILQRIAPMGFEGEVSILRDYLRTIRGSYTPTRPFIRFESLPGQQLQVDWGHFGSLTYGNTTRKLYCLAVIETHSRMLYLEFTHSQRQETLHRCLVNSFRFFRGTTTELVHDNMATAVLERHGPLIRFNDAFLKFLIPFKIVPLPCNVRSPHEKGKVEKGAIHYIRHNFWPLRSFNDLHDVQVQADHWRDTVANVRLHNTTGEKPIDRFQPHAMRPLPDLLPDCRDSDICRVYPDFSIRFDANAYTVPPWAIGKHVVAKADNYTLTIYLKDKVIATHHRSWERKKRIELPSHTEAARKHQRKLWRSQHVAAFISMGEPAKTYLERRSTTNQPIKKTLKKLLELKDQYGTYSLIEAIKKATLHNAFGAHYIENILYQDMTPKTNHPPVKLKNEHLNQIRLERPSLAQYDAFVIRRRKKS